MSESVFSKSIHGLKWVYSSVILTSIFQVVHLTIMARLLDKADFGLLAMAEVILRFGVYFSRMGIGSAIIQKKVLSGEDIRAGFTLSVLLSFAVTTVIIIAAPLANVLFENPEVIPIIRVYAFTMFIAGWNIVAISLLRRNFRFRALFVAEVISYFIGAIVIGITLAYLGMGVWSLVIASLVQGFVLTFIAYAFARHSLRPLFSLCYFRPLISFGSRISLISFLEFINFNIDTIVIGRFFGESLLGIYNQANRLISLPTQKISTSLIQVLFPAFSNMQGEQAKVRRAHLLSLELLGLILFPFSFGISGAAHEVVLVLLGERWVDAIPILRILAIATPFILLNGINGIIFEAQNWLKIKIKLVLLRLIALVGFFLLLFQFGLIGLASSVLIISILFYFVFEWVAQKRLGGSLQISFVSNARISGVGLLTLVLTWLLSVFLNKIGLPIMLVLIIQAIVGGLVLGFFILILPPRSIVEFANQNLIWHLPFEDKAPIRWIKNRYQKLYSR